ncbi:MAG: cobalt-precorrin-5B (C(1))-methyltransferase [Dehalococcoidia bacterium]|nr:Cobalt-precorrin-5B C(1)-methyltransferase [Chloroflexota bacterium]MBT9159138.1 Cobalt-precorrin-5B C(1)-methyltransferase [Chloroflexota bacterium]
MDRQNNKLLRSGYTTGACAAAAAKAAALALLSQRTIDEVQIALPTGGRVNFAVSRCVFNSLEASCSMIKDAGDDPDVTDGAEICAVVSWSKERGVTIEGGKGVGLVTKPGLEIPVGMAAINPVPRRMIIRSVSEAAGLENRGMQVIISVPQGEGLAKRTLNRRLGIVGGISILGTSGVVIPYSVQAYKVSISQALDVAVATGCREAVLTTGRRSERFAQRELMLPGESFIQMGDFVGHAVEECARKGLAKVIIWGMVGKLSKIAAGHLYTNVSDSRVDVDFLAGVAASGGVPEATVIALRKAANAHHFLQILGTDKITKICDKLCLLAARRCREYVKGALEVECVMTDYNGTILGRASVKG